ncbi:O-acyltransferase like protein-like isoform X2 [Wyeomyia smithii]|uniref:O-acyltransferase like protein-like isoform X2 n=1 Tax=Wyeomyia smithii TaxID=174621 RepID=UPI0024681E60|nr:O-acyltransferase like protein-like isoform X2 [Wyeomyia smithii]
MERSVEPWRHFPKLYDYDDFDECKRANPDKYQYCVVKAHLEENASSQLWREINQYSNDPRHYRRDIIELGICLDRCTLVSLEEDGRHHSTASTRDSKFAKECASERIKLNYGLNSSSRTSTCVGASNNIVDSSSTILPETLFNAIIAAIGTLIITSTIIDVKNLPCKGSRLIKSFSLSENLRKLGALNSRSRNDLLFLDGARVLTMMVILLLHASIPLLRFPLKNPESVEQQFDMAWFPVLLAGNTYVVQQFFFFGGAVLAVNFTDHIQANSDFKFSYFVNRVFNRLFRIFPVYALVVLFQASWFQRLQNGPMAFRYKDYCRENWWTNLLFVNNYIRPSEPCAQFTWYMGADFQLFLVGTIVMMVIWKYPRTFWFIIRAMIVFAFVVPAVIIYVYKLDATVMVINRYLTNEIRNLDFYTKVYVTFESNAGNYFFGMITGMIYQKLNIKKKQLESIKHFKLMFLTVGIFFITMMALTMVLPRDQLHSRSLPTAIYGSLLKSSWGILTAMLMLYLCFQPGSLFGCLLQHPIMLVAAKLTYCAYVAQYSVIYTIYRNITTPLMYNGINLVLFSSTVLFVTLLVAFLLHVCVEMPFITLLKPLLDWRQRKKDQ